MGSRAVRLAVFAAAVALLGLGQAELARAAVGDIRRDLPAGSPGGVSVAFDGANLFYTDRNGVVLHSMSAAGTPRPDVPIVGAAGVNALTYDPTREFFWAVDATGLAVYKLTKDGLALPQFVLVPALDLPGLCDVPIGCSPVVSGLAYDATTDSLWYAPEGSQRVYHLTTAGQLIGWFDTNEPAGSLFPECTTNGVSGLAAGADSVYVAAATCGSSFRYAKSDDVAATKLSSFAAPAGGGDLECDFVTFSVDVVWVRSTADGHLRAIEVAPGTCKVPIVRIQGWMSGSGNADITEAAAPPIPAGLSIPVQHAFHILCQQLPGAGAPNNLVINWKDTDGTKFSFHLDTVISTTCQFDPTFAAANPPQCQPDPTDVDKCFNKMFGDGYGWLMGRTPGGQITFGGTRAQCKNPDTPCGFVHFEFIDQGEPNRSDIGSLQVNDLAQHPDDGPILMACVCTDSRYQAHPHE